MLSHLSWLATAGLLMAAHWPTANAIPASKALMHRSAAADDNFSYVVFFADKFLSMSGNITVPPRIPAGGTPYVWPGLQPEDQGVLQPVLDGRNQHWYFGNAWVGEPSEPYGGGVDCSVNQELGFYMKNYDGNGNWDIGVNNGNNRADYRYDLGIQMTQGLFCVEIYSDATWDFGDAVWSNIIITAAGTDASWCTSKPQQSNVKAQIENVSSSVSNGVVTCKIGKITLSPP